MRLDLSDNEARELGVALSGQLHSLRVELAAAEIREFKADLRGRLDRLEGIAARLAAARAAGLPPAVDSRRRERLAQPEEAAAEAEELFARGPISPARRAEAMMANPDTAEMEADRLRASSWQHSDEERPNSWQHSDEERPAPHAKKTD